MEVIGYTSQITRGLWIAGFCWLALSAPKTVSGNSLEPWRTPNISENAIACSTICVVYINK